MTAIVLGVLGGLVFLVGLSVYSALLLAKRSDELIEEALEEEEAASGPPLTVRFPSHVFPRQTAGLPR